MNDASPLETFVCYAIAFAAGAVSTLSIATDGKWIRQHHHVHKGKHQKLNAANECQTTRESGLAFICSFFLSVIRKRLLFGLCRRWLIAQCRSAVRQ